MYSLKNNPITELSPAEFHKKVDESVEATRIALMETAKIYTELACEFDKLAAIELIQNTNIIEYDKDRPPTEQEIKERRTKLVKEFTKAALKARSIFVHLKNSTMPGLFDNAALLAPDDFYNLMLEEIKRFRVEELGIPSDDYNPTLDEMRDYFYSIENVHLQ